MESLGLTYHTPDGQTYWDESAYYRFSAAEVDLLEKASYDLDRMCLSAVQHVIDTDQFARFGIAPPVAQWIARSWERDELTINGRFDLAFDGHSPPKLLEYNADTPTALLEASVIQWHWMKDVLPALDQFNSIHERLIEAWSAVKATLPGPMYFTCMQGDAEDFMTLTYLRDTAIQGGLRTQHIDIERIGWNWDRGVFVDEAEQQILNCCKLYPWEWMLQEPFGPQLLAENTRWFEPPWKMLLSNKTLLVVLHELFPSSPYLLPASLDLPAGGSFVRKPVLGREGANVQTVTNGQVSDETGGTYGPPYVYQQLYPIQSFGGIYPVIGSWMVNGYACGIGVREDTNRITQNTSRFVPHVFG